MITRVRKPADELAPISPDLLYPLPALQRISGMGEAALRSARRSGLQVRYSGGRCYVYGRHYIEFILSQPTEKSGGTDAVSKD